MNNATLPRLESVKGFIRQHGLKASLKQANYRLTNLFLDVALNVDTHGKVTMREVGIDNEDCHEYTAIGYRAIRDAIKRVPLAPKDISFIDIGSGKARPVIVAARMGCRSAYGVDISPQLNAIARKNIERMRFRKTRFAEIYDGDAATLYLPPNVNVVYMANAFSGEVLRKCVATILKSYDMRPREMYVIYFNPPLFDQMISGNARIKCIDRWEGFPKTHPGALYSISPLRPESSR